MVILNFEEEVTEALACPLRKVKIIQYFVYSHRSTDYNPKRESTTTTAEARLPDLPLPLYARAYIDAILSSFAYFLDVDDRTKACLSMKFADRKKRVALT